MGDHRIYLDCAACDMCSFLHTDESQSRGSWRAFSQALHIEAYPIVLNRQKQHIAIFHKLQKYVAGPGMAHNIG